MSDFQYLYRRVIDTSCPSKVRPPEDNQIMVFLNPTKGTETLANSTVVGKQEQDIQYDDKIKLLT